MTLEDTNAQLMVVAMPNACTPSSSKPPPWKSPSRSGPAMSEDCEKRPTANKPQIPAVPCTPTAPTGSSKICQRTRALLVASAMAAPSPPTSSASRGVMAAQPAVMATRPERMPLTTALTSTAPLVRQLVMAMPTRAPPMLALMVVTAMREAASHFKPVMPKVEPQLKPSQPHQSMKVPKMQFIGFCIPNSPCRSGSQRPTLGPISHALTMPLTAPRRCTGPSPAKS
mmetsp:Transcript_56305/g.174698  ORF Transcript_56305/g.174698 Transcript_56305/m.174698 type:complete len:227 (-) Transcript_56305:658-1338(-)